MAKKSLEAKKDASMLLIGIATGVVICIICYFSYYLGRQFANVDVKQCTNTQEVSK